jgi:hypothetical protein
LLPVDISSFRLLYEHGRYFDDKTLSWNPVFASQDSASAVLDKITLCSHPLLEEMMIRRRTTMTIFDDSSSFSLLDAFLKGSHQYFLFFEELFLLIDSSLSLFDALAVFPRQRRFSLLILKRNSFLCTNPRENTVSSLGMLL